MARSVRLTGRGAAVMLLAVSLLGVLLAELVGMPVLAGIGFVAGCLVAVLRVRASDLLPFVVSPPLLFLMASLLGETLASLGSQSLVKALLIGTASLLAEIAPWLFIGTGLVLVISWPRGLPATIRQFRAELLGRDDLGEN